MQKYKIFNEDCFKKLPQIKNNVDFVLVDPPYGTTDCSWDKEFDFDLMWKQLHDISTPLTTYLFFGSEPFSTKLKYSNLNEYRYDWYWIKPKLSGFLHSKNKPMTNVEMISVFSRGYVVHKGTSDKRMTYNPQGLIKIEEKVHKSKKVKKATFKTASFKNDTYVPKYKNYPKQTLYYNQVKNPIHPTQKPVDLLEYLIKTYSNEGDTVLDFTMGSGSTGVACMNTGRKFIGIEKDEQYFKLAEKRIKESIIQTKLI